MFEEESEEICSKYFEENCYKKNKWADTHDLVAMWQDGYNKAKEEMQENGLALQSDMDKTIEQNIQLKKQIEKMRNFENCDYQLHVTDCPIFKSGRHISCKKCPHWILQEIKENDL